ncbi:MAG: GTPase HflX [Candidatus Anaerobiospirillum merdipullorum]|uniref:GTPase HflX n=1 Tax=Candidatus Anaerobiospirillum merdipullorum TaxID=2838450 RepID=A0A9E2NRB5_9GAMM|nr:GTPase HflX [Candidatus Anaerobiospirillum merdipullorum]
MSEQAVEALGCTVLMHVELPREENREDLEELMRLAQAAGGSGLRALVCKREEPDPRTFIGSGKVLELKQAVQDEGAQTVIFNARLTPAQERNLEQELKVRVMDRIALILNIFAQRARTYEGKLQVELARLHYEQARLVRGWTHLERQKGGFGLRGGPGETQIELDRRALRERIARIKADLAVVAARREQNRNKRKKNALPLISLVGYTNAGKSSLFNYLTKSEVFAADLLFATLDPTLRTIELPGAGKVVLADTVGFIRHLPHDLVAAFRATLEESAQADLQLHVVDAADPRLEDNIKAVEAVLAQIDALDVPRLLVFNKADLVPGMEVGLIRDENGRPVRVNLSAKSGAGTEDLLQAIRELIALDLCKFTAKILPHEGKLLAALYALKAIEHTDYADDGAQLITVRIRALEAARMDKAFNGALARACQQRPVPWQEPLDFAPINLDLLNS